MKDKKRVGGEEIFFLTLFCLIAAGEQTVQNVEFWARAFQSKAEIVWKDKRTLLFLPLPAELHIAVGSFLWLTEMWKGAFLGCSEVCRRCLLLWCVKLQKLSTVHISLCQEITKQSWDSEWVGWVCPLHLVLWSTGTGEIVQTESDSTVIPWLRCPLAIRFMIMLSFAVMLRYIIPIYRSIKISLSENITDLTTSFCEGWTSRFQILENNSSCCINADVAETKSQSVVSKKWKW